MRILILGNNYTQRAFAKYFKRNKENIVFSSSDNISNNINFSDFKDIIEFCEANEINFVIPTEEKFVSSALEKYLNDINVTYFAPNEEAFEIVRYKSQAKRFMYKNKIAAPRFFITEKPQLTPDFIQNTNYPVAIHPDESSYIERVKFAETFSSTQKYVNEFFENGNKKVILEDYIQGKNVIFWTISDGYNAEIIGICANYEDEISYFEPEFINEDIKQEIFENIINPTILNLSYEDTEYVGILGFNIIIDKNNFPYLLNYKGFFDDLSVDFFLNNSNTDCLKIFESCLKGDIFLKYKFNQKLDYMLTIRDDEKIEFISANTKTNLERYIEELGLDSKKYREAKRIWKY